jgi:hypothetical protein
MNSTLKRKSQLAHMKHQFLLDEHFRLAIIVAALILALYGPDNSAAFKKIAARCSQAICLPKLF